MELLDGKGIPKDIEQLLKNKVQLECFMCMGEFDDGDYSPMMMCMNQHSCCTPCLQSLLKNDSTKQVSCPHCGAPVLRKAVTKNRLLLVIYELVKLYKKRVIELEQECDKLKKNGSGNQLKTSLLAKNPKMVSSFILSVDNAGKMLSGSLMTNDISCSKSQILNTVEKRRENILNYAQRQKIQELKQIVKAQVPFQQVTQIRSGYGSIRKIECMQYFTNLRQLMLYNNHIKTIEGLNNNLKLNVLSLAYNRIDKIDNIGQLKELKRLSIQCNKITKSSAEYMLLYDWKSLESLTISFHQEKKEDNDECFALMFSHHSQVHWQGLKNLYIYNSKNTGQRSRTIVKEFIAKKKSSIQVYWS